MFLDRYVEDYLAELYEIRPEVNSSVLTLSETQSRTYHLNSLRIWGKSIYCVRDLQVSLNSFLAINCNHSVFLSIFMVSSRFYFDNRPPQSLLLEARLPRIEYMPIVIYVRCRGMLHSPGLNADHRYSAGTSILGHPV
jgi:hypothetical protein